MQTVGQQLIIAAIPILPALVFFVLALFGRLLRDNAQYVAILGVTVSLVFSVFALLYVAGIIPGGGQPIEFSVNWIDLGEGGSFPIGVYIDGLAGSRAELHRALRLLGARRSVFVPPDRALVREALGQRCGPKGVYSNEDRRRGALRCDHHLLAGDGHDLL